MENDQKDTADSDEEQDDTQEEQDDSAENESEEDDGEESSEPKLYAGKYKTIEGLEEGYLNAQQLLGRRERQGTEQSRPAPEPVKMPKLSDYVTTDGSIDVAKYDAHMEKYENQRRNESSSAASRASQESSDLIRSETEFPYLKTDPKAARAVISLYRSGNAGSIYDAAREIDELRGNGIKQGEKVGDAKARNELSKRSRAETLRPGTKSRDTGEMTEAKFARLSLEDKKKYLNEQFKSGAYKW